MAKIFWVGLKEKRVKNDSHNIKQKAQGTRHGNGISSTFYYGVQIEYFKRGQKIERLRGQQLQTIL